MKFNKAKQLIVVLVIGLIFIFSFTKKSQKEANNILTYIVDLNKQDLRLYWKNDQGEIINNFQNLKSDLNTKSKELLFAMNGGMYKKDFSPQGLYIENGILISKIDTIQKAFGNFYLQPNGIFYITNKNSGGVCKTIDFVNIDIKFATQSGPLLLIDGKIHSIFREGSEHLNIRNGVGVLPNGQVLFAMSKEKINLYDFASYFKSQGCKNALYLDGFVSKTYLPSKGYHTLEGDFGVMIAETK